MNIDEQLVDCLQSLQRIALHSVLQSGDVRKSIGVQATCYRGSGSDNHCIVDYVTFSPGYKYPTGRGSVRVSFP
jgi:hypothetical protein